MHAAELHVIDDRPSFIFVQAKFTIEVCFQSNLNASWSVQNAMHDAIHDAMCDALCNAMRDAICDAMCMSTAYADWQDCQYRYWQPAAFEKVIIYLRK